MPAGPRALRSEPPADVVQLQRKEKGESPLESSRSHLFCLFRREPGVEGPTPLPAQPAGHFHWQAPGPRGLSCNRHPDHMAKDTDMDTLRTSFPGAFPLPNRSLKTLSTPARSSAPCFRAGACRMASRKNTALPRRPSQLICGTCCFDDRGRHFLPVDHRPALGLLNHSDRDVLWKKSERRNV